MALIKLIALAAVAPPAAPLVPRARRRLAVARPRGGSSRLLDFFEEGVEEERVAAEALDGADEDGGETEVLAARL